MDTEYVKSFRAMEVPEAHWVRLASCMFKDSVAFWWDSTLRANFIRREFNTITWAEFMEVFNVRYFPEQLKK